ncbi:hypothetical protein VOLCADRAFT_95575 [Volvox carteri f. nagariensis]|uniref:Uncharacterized protein n=1 Tax=Volvox carteri f. nagariensis TaxID=3068 RepID=D8U7Z3_VOLCA|nr:uncharacterized protein VOLCADRAFT_95575 [Volvox carteri f. nagariensis]EFJ44179.1 hypothetical protein VOLCADRAFT_95575 [Volvox carteri f. nagariensis]|eukprot:XP_002954773.1 hypothetical protein VOLCADRAFT_95575 [Volvox carteri f. nagariensis]
MGRFLVTCSVPGVVESRCCGVHDTDQHRRTAVKGGLKMYSYSYPSFAPDASLSPRRGPISQCAPRLSPDGEGSSNTGSRTRQVPARKRARALSTAACCWSRGMACVILTHPWEGVPALQRNAGDELKFTLLNRELSGIASLEGPHTLRVRAALPVGR